MEDMQNEEFHIELKKEIIRICVKKNISKINIYELLINLKENDFFSKRNNLKARIFNIIKSNKSINLKIRGSINDFDIEIVNDIIKNNEKTTKSKIANFLLTSKFTSRLISFMDNIEKKLNDSSNNISNEKIGKNLFIFNYFLPYFLTFVIIIISISIGGLIIIKESFFSTVDNLSRDFYEHKIINYSIILIVLTLLMFSKKNGKLKLVPNLNVTTFLFSLACLISYLLKNVLNIHILSDGSYDDFLDIYSILIFTYIIVILKNIDSIILFSLNIMKEFFFLIIIPLIIITLNGSEGLDFVITLKNLIIDSISLFIRIMSNIWIGISTIFNIDVKSIQSISETKFIRENAYEDIGLGYPFLSDIMYILMDIVKYFIVAFFWFILYLAPKYLFNNYINKKIHIFKDYIEIKINEMFSIFQDDKNKEKSFSYSVFTYENNKIKIISIILVFFILIWLSISNAFFKDLYYSSYTKKNDGYCANINKDVYILKKDDRVLIDGKYLDYINTYQEMKYKQDKNKENRFFYYPCTFNEDYED